MSKPPKIVIPGLNRGAGIPGGYVVGRRRGTKQGPAELLDLTQVRGQGIATVVQVTQAVASLSTAVSTTVGAFNPAMLLGGDAGEDGAPGPPGPAGAAGAAGSAGATGPQGAPGFGMDGADGEEGIAIPGMPGAAGAAGANGAAGPQGPMGFALDGIDGEEGMPIPGVPGAAGAAGSTGATGPQGAPGFGMDGADGEEGMAIPGVPGAAGASGTSLTVGSFDTTKTAFTDAGNTTTTESLLFNWTAPAGQLAADGDRIVLTASGTFVSSASATRQIKVSCGGTTIFDSGALTINVSGAVWVVACEVMRTSSTSVRCTVDLETEGAALASYTSYTEVTGLTLSNILNTKVTGTAAGVGAASNDIVCKMGAAEFKPSTPDVISSSVQGDILYRGASVWTRLPAGTSGQVLQTNGAGADPSWVTPSGADEAGCDTLDHATAQSFAVNFFGGRHIVVPKTGSPASVRMHVRVANASSVAQPAIYAVGPTGTLGARLAYGSAVTGLTAGWNVFPLTTVTSLTKGDTVCVGIVLTASAVTTSTAMESAGAFFSTSAIPPPDPAGATTNTKQTWQTFRLLMA